jgi:dihydropteroate synthase
MVMKSNLNKIPRFQLNCAGKVLDLSAEPKIMGILNTTPDSFYDGGALQGNTKTLDLDRALDYALTLIESGASIIDIGGESSRPGAEKISEREEIARTVPLIALLRQKTDILISIDTYKGSYCQ